MCEEGEKALGSILNRNYNIRFLIRLILCVGFSFIYILCAQLCFFFKAIDFQRLLLHCLLLDENLCTLSDLMASG